MGNETIKEPALFAFAYGEQAEFLLSLKRNNVVGIHDIQSIDYTIAGQEKVTIEKAKDEATPPFHIYLYLRNLYATDEQKIVYALCQSREEVKLLQDKYSVLGWRLFHGASAPPKTMTQVPVFIPIYEPTQVKTSLPKPPLQYRASAAIALSVLPMVVWGLFNTHLFYVPVEAALFLSAAVVPVIAGFSLACVFYALQEPIYRKAHQSHHRDKLVFRYMKEKAESYASQFIVGTLASNLVSFFVLDQLKKVLTAGVMLAGAPLEAQMVMMVISGVVFGLAMLAMKQREAVLTNSPLSTAQIVSCLVTGLVAGIGFYVASLIPSFNDTYKVGMPSETASLLSVIGYMAVLATTFGNYMFSSIREYDRKENSHMYTSRLSMFSWNPAAKKNVADNEKKVIPAQRIEEQFVM